MAPIVQTLEPMATAQIAEDIILDLAIGMAFPIAYRSYTKQHGLVHICKN